VNRSLLSSIFVAMLLADALAGAGEPGSPRQPEDKLQPYVYCDGFAGGIRAVTLDRRPRTAEPWRAGSDEVGARVSVVDGYRVMYSYARTFAFANLKAEQSDSSRYSEDKRIVTFNLASMAKADRLLDLAEFSHMGFSVQTLTKRELAGRSLGMAQIFSDADSVIVTVFFLNQQPQYRKFQTHEEFIFLRDAFVRGYIECAAEKRAALLF